MSVLNTPTHTAEPRNAQRTQVQKKTGLLITCSLYSSVSVTWLLYLVAKSCLIFCSPMDCILQTPLSMGFPRQYWDSQEYWSELPFTSPEDLPDPETEPISLAWAGLFFTTEPPGNSNKVQKSNVFGSRKEAQGIKCSEIQ